MNRFFSIKVNVVKRIKKEREAYEREAQDQENRIQTVYKDADEHTVRKQYQVHDETMRMLPECTIRYEAALDDLKKFVDKNKDKLSDTQMSVFNSIVA